MANRTYKVMGKCYAASESINLAVSFNGNMVYNGPVTADVSPLPNKIEHDALVELCTFTASTDIHGNVPVEITSTGGICIFSQFMANYRGCKVSWAADQTREILISPEDFFLGTAKAPPAEDCKHDVKIDAIDVTATLNVDDTENSTNTTGWHYQIPSGSTLTCSYYIDPDQIELEAPAVPFGLPPVYPYLKEY